MSKRIADADLHDLGWELHADDGRWYWAGDKDSGDGGGSGGDSFWVEESPGVIKYTGTAKATDVVATG